MLMLTEKATLKIKEVLGGQPETCTGVRIAVVGGGCSGFQYEMNLETDEREGDHVVQADGFKLYIDDNSLPYLKGTEIDYVETAEEAGFTFNNPNAKSTCGCGESFQC